MKTEQLQIEYTAFINDLQQRREHREEYLKNYLIINKYTDEEVKRFNANELKLEAYETENAWWYYFFQAVGSNNYDPEYANSLRIDGIQPKEAAEKARI